MTLENAKAELEKFVKLKTSMRPSFVQPLLDAVEVVRCKDCKKYIPCQKLPIGTSKWCDLFDRATCEMNYCGWGERRTDETD